MKDIQLENGRTIETHCEGEDYHIRDFGIPIETAQLLLQEWEDGGGYIPSEADIRLLSVRNFKNNPELINSCWNTSTLLATKGETMKVILPYETGNKTLTKVARFGLGLIGVERIFSDRCFSALTQYEPHPEISPYIFGANLDIDGRWGYFNKKNEGDGVYTFKRNELTLDKSFREKEAQKDKLILTKLGHPEYVDSKFARSGDEVAEIIGETFRLGKKAYGRETMMEQFGYNVRDEAILEAWCVGGLDSGNWSVHWYDMFPFIKVEDAKI
ncbi:hypothetical protein KAT80_01165 [Candidatus Pacearchaeota archaeon]|nr:hypothetical protein [Candidatus Pacearchaeota archaeon]